MDILAVLRLDLARRDPDLLSRAQEVAVRADAAVEEDRGPTEAEGAAVGEARHRNLSRCRARNSEK